MERTRLRAPIALAALALAAPSLAAERPDVRASLLAPPRLAPGAKATVAVELRIGEGWHVNGHVPADELLVPTEVVLAAPGTKLSPVRYPKHVERRFPFSDRPLRVYDGTVSFEADLELPAGAAGSVTVEGSVSYQACNERQCFAPASLPLQARISTAR